ncbi:helix-turn-helix transcriptional regulator [Consotaella sp. CSK11QG-6]
MPADVDIGARIRSRRTALGMSQEKLGDACGITFQQIQKYEKGTNRVGGSRIVQIAAALQCSPSDLIVGSDTEPVPFFPAEVLRLAQRLAVLEPERRRTITKSLSDIMTAIEAAATNTNREAA